MCYYLAGSRTSKLRKTSVRQVGQLWQFWEVSKQIALIDGFTTLSYLLDICNDIAESIKQFTLAFEANSRGKAACDILAMMAMAQTIAGLVISISSHFFNCIFFYVLLVRSIMTLMWQRTRSFILWRVHVFHEFCFIGAYEEAERNLIRALKMDSRNLLGLFATLNLQLCQTRLNDAGVGMEVRLIIYVKWMWRVMDKTS